MNKLYTEAAAVIADHFDNIDEALALAMVRAAWRVSRGRLVARKAPAKDAGAAECGFWAGIHNGRYIRVWRQVSPAVSREILRFRYFSQGAQWHKDMMAAWELAEPVGAATIKADDYANSGI